MTKTDKTVEAEAYYTDPTKVIQRLNETAERIWGHGAQSACLDAAAVIARLQEEVKGLRDNLRYEDEWPATPVSNALHEHFLAVYGLNNEEACESVGEILDVINKALATLQGHQS